MPFLQLQVWVQASCFLLTCLLKTAAVSSAWCDALCLWAFFSTSWLIIHPQASPHLPGKLQSSEVKHRLWLKGGEQGVQSRQWTWVLTSPFLGDLISSSKNIGTLCGKTGKRWQWDPSALWSGQVECQMQWLVWRKPSGFWPLIALLQCAFYTGPQHTSLCF